MKVPAHQLLTELSQLTQQLLSAAESLQTLTLTQLNWREISASWSILECIEHLNRYGNFYLPEIEARIHRGKPAVTIDSTFRSGWLGNYFANLMRSTKKSSRMRTFSSMNPLGSTLDLKVLDEFIRQQQLLLQLLNKAKQVDLTQTRTSISLSRFITLRLGDTLRFVIYHNQRHVNQAKRALAAQKQAERVIS